MTSYFAEGGKSKEIFGHMSTMSYFAIFALRGGGAPLAEPCHQALTFSSIGVPKQLTILTSSEIIYDSLHRF
jgi:hypothetical protein